jgi:hypothetical protein
MNEIKIPEQLAINLLDYLAEKPYKETANLIQQLGQAVQKSKQEAKNGTTTEKPE